MDLTLAERLLYLTPTPLFALLISAVTWTAFFFGRAARKGIFYRQSEELVKETGRGFLINSAVGVLALILGFTFSIALGHIQARQHLVVDEANALLSAYAYSQAVEGGDAPAMRRLLLSYAAVQLESGRTDDVRKAHALLARSEALETQMLASAALVTRQARIGVSISYLQSVLEIAKIAASRMAAKRVHVPTQVYAAILINLAMVAAGIGFEFTGATKYVVAAVLLLLLTVSIVLIVDLDRPLNSAGTAPQSALEDAYHRISTDGLSTAMATGTLAGADRSTASASMKPSARP